jgi:hypothetical protein
MYAQDETTLDIMSEDFTPTMDYFKIYIMADRYSLEKLKSTVMSFLRRGTAWRIDVEPDICDIQYIYKNTPSSKDDPARKFLVDMTLNWFFGTMNNAADLPNRLPGLTTCNIDFSSDLISAIGTHILLHPRGCPLIWCSIHHGIRYFWEVEERK